MERDETKARDKGKSTEERMEEEEEKEEKEEDGGQGGRSERECGEQRRAVESGSILVRV